METDVLPLPPGAGLGIAIFSPTATQYFIVTTSTTTTYKEPKFPWGSPKFPVKACTSSNVCSLKTQMTRPVSVRYSYCRVQLSVRTKVQVFSPIASNVACHTDFNVYWLYINYSLTQLFVFSTKVLLVLVHRLILVKCRLCNRLFDSVHHHSNAWVEFA